MACVGSGLRSSASDWMCCSPKPSSSLLSFLSYVLGLGGEGWAVGDRGWRDG